MIIIITEQSRQRVGQYGDRVKTTKMNVRKQNWESNYRFVLHCDGSTQRVVGSCCHKDSVDALGYGELHVVRRGRGNSQTLRLI